MMRKLHGRGFVVYEKYRNEVGRFLPKLKGRK